MGYQRNTRRNATGNTYNTAPLSFNPMSHVGTNADSQANVGAFLLEEMATSMKECEINQSGLDHCGKSSSCKMIGFAPVLFTTSIILITSL